MAKLTLAIALAFAFLVTACPDKRDQVIEEVGGAPKRQLDHVQERVDRASENIADRLNRATEETEE